MGTNLITDYTVQQMLVVQMLAWVEATANFCVSLSENVPDSNL